jgi:hypothetical protein
MMNPNKIWEFFHFLRIEYEIRLKKTWRMLALIIGVILFLWTVTTLWAQWSGASKVVQSSPEATVTKRICIYYNPDPIYNLDEQVCMHMMQTLSAECYVEVRTTQSGVSSEDFDAFIFCANTYNFAPDWGVTGVMSRLKEKTRGKTVGLLTLGAGSTGRAERLLKKSALPHDEANVLEKTIWLMKPNADEVQSREDNLKLAKEMAAEFSKAVLVQTPLNN